MKHNFTAIVHQESLSDGTPIFVAHCPEIDVTSQGDTEAEAIANVREAVEGVLEVATPREIRERLRAGATVQAFEIAA